MPNNNVAILSIMSKFDEKSAREAAKRADKVYEEALSDIGNVNFDKKLIENFDKAMNLLKNKFKKVNLSSYTNNLLDSIFSDKDITEKSKDIELFINKIEMLKKASSGQDINAFNTFSAKQTDALISRTEKLAQKQEEINEKTREYNREATKIAKANRSISTIDKNYGNQDYSKTLESLKKSLGTEKEFTAEQNQSIENLAKMVNLYQTMEKSEPQKGTAEAIRYSKDLLAVTQKIKEERDKIDAFSKKGASTYITNNGLSSIDKVSDYTVNKSKEDFVKASLSNLKSQEAKLQSELTTYISDSVQKNLAKVSKEVDAVVDKAEKRVENLQNKIESLQTKSTKTGSDNSIIGGIVSETDIKTLEEIEDRLFAIQDKYLEVDENGYATNDLSTKELKEFISLYKEYEQLPSDNKFESDLPDTYKSIIESDENLKKYADTLDETISKQKELNVVKSDEYNTSVDTQTEQLVKQEEQIKETIQAEKQLQDTQEKVSSNTKISVDAEQAIADINKIKESLDSIPEEKNIKIIISDSDYTNTPLLSNESGEIVTAFRGVKDAWSGLINDKGIGFFTDKLKLAVDYADELSKDGKVYQANLSFHNPLEVDGKGARWDQIDFNGIKQKTDDIIQLAKQLGHDGVIFKNIRDGFTDTDEDISNVMVALNAAQIKNEQVIGTVKAGTGEMVDVASKIDNATDTATNSTVESQNKIQEELKETQKIAEQVSEAMNNVGSDKSNISSVSPTQNFDNSIQQDIVMLENYKNTIKEIDALKLEPETEETKAKIEELNKLADYFVSKISVIRSENGGYVSQSMMKFSGQWNEILKKYPDNARNELYKLASEKSGLQIGSVSTEFTGIEKEISNIESKSETLRLSLTQSMQDSIKYVKELKYAFTTLVASQDELKTEKNPKWIEGFNSDINKALSKFPELIQFKDKFTEDQALQFVKTDEWNKFLSTLPQAQEYLKSIGYSFGEIKESSTSPMKDVFQGDNNSNTSFNSNLDEIEKEKSALLELRNTVSLIIEEIDRKTQAFHNEKSAVDLIIPEEIATLESLERELKIIIESIEQISKIPINIDFNLENLDENSANVISKLKDSLSGFNGSSLTNISSILEGFKISKANVENLQKLANAILTLKSNLNNVGNLGQQFLSDIKELVAQSDGLKDLATVLKSSQKQIDNAKKTTNANVDSKNTEENANAWKELTYSIQRYSEVSKRISSGKALEGDIEEASRLENKISQLQKLDILSPTQIEKSEQMLTKLYDSLDDIEKKSKEATLESLNSSIDKYRNDYNSRSSKPVANNQSDEYKKLLANYETSIAKLEAYRDKISNNPLVSKEDLNQIDELTKKVKKSAIAFNSLTASQKGSTPHSRGKAIEWANDLLEQNSKWSKKAKIEVQGWINKLASADPSNVEEIRNRILEIVRAEREAGNAGKTWLDIFSTKKLHSFLGQAAGMFSFYDLVNVGREGFQTIRELDTALTEMKKVSDETTQSLKNYQATTFDVGDAVGATAKTIQESTADWMRLGESMNEAAESAKASNILLNVSEFESIDEATESLVAMSQAYSELGKMDIIDVLNNIGNNYSIATDGLATALQKSASALKTANNDLNSAVALATAGNAVVQDPDSVGAGIRTISLRLVGTEAAKQELESIGEETDDVITTTSKLRDTILSATAAATNDGKGFDIFDSNGNYKSTYEIMQGLADLYDDIVAKDKELGTNNLNLLLETIAGKNRSNIAASILQNGEMLRSVYQDAQNSSGSAQKELDSYLDSIDGRMTQLENRAQEFWYKVIDSDTIKNGITLLTDLLELGTNIVDTFGVLPTIMAGVGAGLAVKNVGINTLVAY